MRKNIENFVFIANAIRFNRASERSGAFSTLGTAIKISEELLNDSVFDLPSYIAREFARRIGAKEEEPFFVGDGSGKPLGLFDKTVGEAFAKGVCKAFGVSYKAPSATSTSTQTAKKTIYRIQVGAFADKKNADAYLKKVQSAGFKDAFITTVTKS